MAFSRLLVAAAATAAAAQTWYGLTPNANNAGSVDLVTLSDNAAIQSRIGTVLLGAGERTWPDGFRCIRGFCLFATSAYKGGPIPTGSFVYNISASNAAILSKTACPGFCRDMHVDYSSGRAFVTSITQQATTVVDVTNRGATPVIDLTQQIGSGTINPGQTTHCSEDGPGGHIFVGVNSGGSGKDFVIDVDLAAAKVVNVIHLSVPLFDALWATCTGNGLIGGISFTAGSGSGNGTATFGSVDGNGAYTAGDSVSVPAGYVPTGLLTGTGDAVHFLAPLFPQYTPTNATGVSGYLWAVAPYGGSDDYVTEFNYYLIGAAWDMGA